MFAGHPGRRIAVVAFLVGVATLWFMPNELRQSISLKLTGGFGQMLPAIGIGGLVGFLSFSRIVWLSTTIVLLLSTVALVYAYDPLFWGWGALAGAICLIVLIIVGQLKAKGSMSPDRSRADEMAWRVRTHKWPSTRPAGTGEGGEPNQISPKEPAKESITVPARGFDSIEDKTFAARAGWAELISPQEAEEAEPAARKRADDGIV